ncbi:MAG: carbon-nitrogen hydrolase family protein [Nanoarchaeota archaeon]|nr:carbon-nitrogen hydrolase family protein [Nanoarchaeota archaeon]
MKMRVAVVQFRVRDFSEEENIDLAEMFIKRAVKKKADLIVFPEDFISRTTSEESEFRNSSRNVKKIRGLAKKYKIDVVPGSFIQKEGRKKYNTSYYIDSKGDILSEYKKNHLWSTERKNLRPGKRVSVFRTKYGMVGLILCWDMMFPEMFRKMIRKGAQIVICPSYWCYEDAGKGRQYDLKAEEKLVDSLCVERAFEEEIAFVFCNASGKNKKSNAKETLVGHSQITAPFKGVLKKLNHNREGMIIADVDLRLVDSAERSYGIRNDVVKR